MKLPFCYCVLKPLVFAGVSAAIAYYLGRKNGLVKGMCTTFKSTSSRTKDILYQYVNEHSLRESVHLRELRDATMKLSSCEMLSPPEQGQLFQLLLHTLNATRVIEVGVYTGYNTLSMSLALPSNGCVVALDISSEFTDVGKPYWEKAGQASKIDLRLCDANETLDNMIAAGEEGCYDFAFIDADKTNYDNYYERCLRLVRTGGLICIDNVLWGGAVVDDGRPATADTIAIRALNDKIFVDQRVEISMLAISDGITLCRKL